jgi:hypothetical protein
MPSVADPRITIRLTPGLVERLDARRGSVSRGAFVRGALEEALGYGKPEAASASPRASDERARFVPEWKRRLPVGRGPSGPIPKGGAK